MRPRGQSLRQLGSSHPNYTGVPGAMFRGRPGVANVPRGVGLHSKPMPVSHNGRKWISLSLACSKRELRKKLCDSLESSHGAVLLRSSSHAECQFISTNPHMGSRLPASITSAALLFSLRELCADAIHRSCLFGLRAPNRLGLSSSSRQRCTAVTSASSIDRPENDYLTGSTE